MKMFDTLAADAVPVSDPDPGWAGDGPRGALEPVRHGAQVSSLVTVILVIISAIPRATFIPCFVEAAAVAGLSHFIMGFPLTVGLYCTLYTVLYCTVLYCTVLYCTVGGADAGVRAGRRVARSHHPLPHQHRGEVSNQ